jgi:general secretion pathway protein K
MADAKLAVTARERAHFTSNDDAVKSVPAFKDKLKEAQHSINTRFFEVVGRIRLEQTMVEERSLVDRRDTNNVKTLWRERAVVAAPEINENTSAQP